MTIKTLGVDLGKFSCHVIGQDQHGKIVEKRKVTLAKFAEYLANLPRCAIYFEACGGAHHWCRKARDLGHMNLGGHPLVSRSQQRNQTRAHG